MDSFFEKLKVLLVDDEQFIRQLVARLLGEIGVKEVFTANDGDEAIKRLTTYAGRIDLVILDLEMPNRNGFQVVRDIRSGNTQINPDLPIIILTGHGQEEAITAAVNLGIHGFLVKPMSKDALIKRIRAALTTGRIDPRILEH